MLVRVRLYYMGEDLIEKELKDVEKKIEMLSNVSAAVSVGDVGAIGVDNLKEMVSDFGGGGKKDDVTEEELRKIILERVRNADPEVRNSVVNKIANLKRINPDNRSFTTVNESKRLALLKKLHERRGHLGMRRKPKHILEKMKAEVENQMMVGAALAGGEATPPTTDPINMVGGRRKNNSRGRNRVAKLKQFRAAADHLDT